MHRVKEPPRHAYRDSVKGGEQTTMATNHGIIKELSRAYATELETVQNYLANSIDLDGVRAEEIKKALLCDIEEELGHATSGLRFQRPLVFRWHLKLNF
jgi:ferritin-like protein